MPPHDFGQCPLEHVDAKLAANAYCGDDVVGRAALRRELCDEPETMLRRRERLIPDSRPADRGTGLRRVALAGQQLDERGSMPPQRVAEVGRQRNGIAACAQLTVLERQGDAPQLAFVEQRQQFPVHRTILLFQFVGCSSRQKSGQYPLTGTASGNAFLQISADLERAPLPDEAGRQQPFAGFQPYDAGFLSSRDHDRGLEARRHDR